MSDYETMDEARRRINTYGANPASHHRSSAEKAVLAERERKRRESYSGSSSDTGGAEALGGLVAVVLMAALFVKALEYALIWVAFPAAVLFWIAMALKFPRSATLGLLLAGVLPAIWATAAGWTRIDIFGFVVIRGLDLGSPEWTVPALWGMVGLLVFSFPLGFMTVGLLRNLGYGLAGGLLRRSAVAVLPVALMAFLPLLLLVPMLLWVGLSGMPGSIGFPGITSATASDPEILWAAIPRGAELLWPELLRGAPWPFYAWIGLIGAMFLRSIWCVTREFRGSPVRRETLDRVSRSCLSSFDGEV